MMKDRNMAVDGTMGKDHTRRRAMRAIQCMGLRVRAVRVRIWVAAAAGGDDAGSVMGVVVELSMESTGTKNDYGCYLGDLQ